MKKIKLFGDIEDSKEKEFAEEEFRLASVRLDEGTHLLKRSKERVELLSREMNRLEAINEIKTREENGKLRRENKKDNDGGTLQAMLTGAGGMLLVIITIQWLNTHRNQRRPQQAFVPVRYVATSHNGFTLPTKRL